MAVREERRAAAREAILSAAEALVTEGGYSAASVSDVARRAAVATGSIYRHFPSKGELLADVFRRAAERELAVIGAITEDAAVPAAERLAATVEAFARRALASPTLAYALMAEPVDPAVEAARLQNKRAYRARFAALLRAGAQDGAWPSLDAELAAAAIVGALQEALLGPLGDARAGAARDPLVASLVHFVLHAVNTSEEPHGHRSHAPVRHA